VIDDFQTAPALTAVLARVLLSRETVETGLRLVTALAHETIAGTAGAGVTVLVAGVPATVAASDAVVERADELQYGLDDGPCLAAWRDRAPVRIDEVHTETRWPRWCGAVASLGVRSALSVPVLTGGEAFGTLKVYAATSTAYDGRAERVLQQFAAQASLLLANVLSEEHARELEAELRDRDLLGQAEGILMARTGRDAEAAFAELVEAAHREHRELADVAREMVDAATHRECAH
jgi:GAF domain-containing protein